MYENLCVICRTISSRLSIPCWDPTVSHAGYAPAVLFSLSSSKRHKGSYLNDLNVSSQGPSDQHISA